MMFMARCEPWSQVFAIGSAVSKVGIDASCPGPTVKSAQREPPCYPSSLWEHIEVLQAYLAAMGGCLHTIKGGKGDLW